MYSEHTSIILECDPLCKQLLKKHINEEQKKQLLSELFEYLIKHKWFIQQHSSLNTVIQSKLTEFATKNKWLNAHDYYYRVYDKHLIQ